MEGLVRLEDSVQFIPPVSGDGIYNRQPLVSDTIISDMRNNCASDESVRRTIKQGLDEIQRLMEQSRIINDGTLSLLFCRDIDGLVDTPLYALKDMIEMLANTTFRDEKKSRNFFRLLRALHEIGTNYKVFTTFDEALEATRVGEDYEGFYDHAHDIKEKGPLTFVVFKLFQFSDWFEEKPLKERVSMILKKDAIKQTTLEILGPLSEEVRKYGEGSRIRVYGPNELRCYKGYDFHRARLEKVIFDEAKRNYGNNPLFEFVDSKSLVGLIRYLRGGGVN